MTDTLYENGGLKAYETEKGDVRIRNEDTIAQVDIGMHDLKEIFKVATMNKQMVLIEIEEPMYPDQAEELEEDLREVLDEHNRDAKVLDQITGNRMTIKSQ